VTAEELVKSLTRHELEVLACGLLRMLRGEDSDVTRPHPPQAESGTRHPEAD
jgi:hypothetical protein